jgi:hypothetical protein
MKFFTILVLLFILIGCTGGNEGELVKPKTAIEKAGPAVHENEIEEIRKSLRADVRIRLKKDPKGGYSWEITGKDAHEVLRANDVLRKKLNE